MFIYDKPTGRNSIATLGDAYELPKGLNKE
jgi:hypothetical protein